jgi:multidrug resistance efflux pump
VTLETDTVDRQLAEQQAAIEAAQASLAKAVAGPRQDEIEKSAAIAANDERDRQRMAVLYRDGIVAKQVFDDAATKARASSEDLQILRKGTRQEDITAARAAVEQEQRRLDSLTQQREESVIESTGAGVVQSFVLRPGDIVAPNQGVAEILEADQLWVRVYVPETLLGLVHVDQAVKVRVDTFPDQWFDGKVSTVASEGEYTPRNVQTRAQRVEQVFGVKVLVNADKRLKAGMAAEVDLGVKGRVE